MTRRGHGGGDDGAARRPGLRPARGGAAGGDRRGRVERRDRAGPARGGLRWVSRVGDDALGTFVTREIRAEGVRVVAVRDPAAPTGLMLKEHRGGRPWRVRYYRAGSAASRLSPADVDAVADEIAAADVLHLTGITAALGAVPAGRGRAGDGGGPGRRHARVLRRQPPGDPVVATRPPRRCWPGSPRPPTSSSPDRRRPRCVLGRDARHRRRSTRASCWRGSWPSAARPPWWSSSAPSARWRCPATTVHRAPALPVDGRRPGRRRRRLRRGLPERGRRRADRCPTPCARPTPAARRSAGCPATGRACPPASSST